MDYDTFLKNDSYEKYWQKSIENFMDGELDDNDSVNHPKHYISGKFEAIDVIEDAIIDAPNTVVGGLQWNVLKYILRMWLKENPKQDAEKARWYLDRLINKLQD